jgi:cytochrome P450
MTVAPAPYSAEAADFDLTSPLHIAAPYPFYRALRADRPVFRSAALQGALVLTRYHDVRATFRDHERYSSVDSLGKGVRIVPDVLELLRSRHADLETFLANLDPPEHTRLRRPVGRSFSVRSMARLEPRVRAEAHRAVDALVGRGAADLVDEVTEVLPALVTADFLGLPRADVDRVRRWVGDWFGLFAVALPEAEQRARAAGYIEYLDYVRGLLERRRERPAADFMSQVLAAQADGSAAMATHEIVEMMTSFTLGGNDTTSHALSCLLHRLLATPGAWDAVVADPALRANAIEEALRIDPPGIAAFRTTRVDVEISGVPVAAGERLLLLQDSANHDEIVFPDPETFDIHRPNAGEHTSFGLGIHHCIGAALARLELRVVLDVLAERLPSLRLEPGYVPAYRPSVIGRNLERLPVRWDERR